MRLLIGMTTADRSPRPNYVAQTLLQLWKQGTPPDLVHVFASAPDVRWLHREIEEKGLLTITDVCTLHVPTKVLTRNQNGIALMTGLPECDWVVHLEDDLELCGDFVGSVTRWLTKHASRDRRAYFFHVPWKTIEATTECWNYPIRGSNWIQSVALRRKDAEDFGRWAITKLPTWRLKRPPRWRYSGFDEMLKKWAIHRYPSIRYWAASNPSFVQHVGAVSLVHFPRPLHKNVTFKGERWSYEPEIQHRDRDTGSVPTSELPGTDTAQPETVGSVGLSNPIST